VCDECGTTQEFQDEDEVDLAGKGWVGLFVNNQFLHYCSKACLLKAVNLSETVQ
jgi:hypothetical protein